MVSRSHPAGQDRDVERERLVGFRQRLYGCFAARADALFELGDAVLCAGGPVTSLVELCQEKRFRRGHGALYDALACGQLDSVAVGRLLACSWEPVDEGPVKVAVDVSTWARPDAETSPERCHCYHSCRCDGARKTIPGWPYSVAAGLSWGASSWTAPLDAMRLGPDDDATIRSVEQVQRVYDNLREAGTLAGRPAPLFVFDSGYDMTRISYLTTEHGLDVQILGRVRGNRVYYTCPPPDNDTDDTDGTGTGTGTGPQRARVGRPARHGRRFKLDEPATLPAPDEQLRGHNQRYGSVTVAAWHGLHQKLARQAGWAAFTGELPIVKGTLIRIKVARLPGRGRRRPQDLWMWWTGPAGTVFDLDLLWKAYLRRFDLEHTFRFVKQELGWTVPQIQTPQQGDRWTWLILAGFTQLRLAAPLTQDMRRRWEKPVPPGAQPTPGRVRRSFPTLVHKLPTPARSPKFSRPGPGRPTGTTRPPRTRYPVGKNQPKTARNHPKKDATPDRATTPTG
ncbi:MAG TPA: NF041680 family putative transposase [Motilibacterales bacterium]|nr:NF041680 family putative transposase [Motilibacterales bacterium]